MRGTCRERLKTNDRSKEEENDAEGLLLFTGLIRLCSKQLETEASLDATVQGTLLHYS